MVIGLGFTLISTIASSELVNADAMYRQLGEVEVIEYDDMIKQIDNAQIPIVDEELAKKQADKKIGQDVALGSRVSLKNVSIQEVDGEIIFVAPLEHSGFFKWNTYRTTPGYITVSASNPNKVNYVTEIDGKKIEIAYQPSAYFGNDLTRHIRNQGFRTEGLTEYTFELDDNGYPYWVVTTYKNRTWWGSPEATGVVIVDAQSGKTHWYSYDNLPDWVDIVQPKEFVETQIDNWGELVHGVFNWSNQDKIKKTDLTLTVYVDGDCYYFTGMTSVGSDESCVGFIMVNTRTKKPYMAYMSGATENAAMKSAEGLVSDFGYTSTEPLPLNVNGIPTYVMALKDAEGLIKSYAMVNIENYSIAVKGNSLAETERSYMQAIARSGNNHVVGSDEAYGYTYEGVVERISSVVQDGTTYYYLVVEGEEEKIFTASYLVSDELAVTRDGDTVKLSYIDDKNGTVDIVSFDNVAFAVPVSDDQNRRDELDQDTSALDSEYNQIVQVNPDLTRETWESMTEEEKAKLLDEYLKNKQ
ncbi:MAG: cell shape-determining protein [Clostridia bacterium]|nr:cell shape-determining protein [Clostridia bacterium]